jgi:hypothetical protein
MVKTWKFYNQKTGKIEEIEPVAWYWEALFNDNTLLKQFDDNGFYHQFGEIDQKKLILFRMRKFGTDKHYDLIFEPDMKLIHFYRNYLLENGKTLIRTFVFGYERKKGEYKEKILTTILPNDDIIIASGDISLDILS